MIKSVQTSARTKFQALASCKSSWIASRIGDGERKLNILGLDGETQEATYDTLSIMKEKPGAALKRRRRWAASAHVAPLTRRTRQSGLMGKIVFKLKQSR